MVFPNDYKATMAQTDKIHIAPGKRGFGLGFGAHHQVVVYTEQGPKTGALLTEPHCAALRTWGEGGDPRSITDIIAPEALMPALQNRLLHSDMIELVRILPTLLEQLSPEIRTVLFDKPLAGVPAAMWKELAGTRPQLQAQGFDPAYPQRYFSALNHAGTGGDVSATRDDLTFNGVSMEAVASVLPMLFDALDIDARVQVARAFAEALHRAGEDKAFFGPLQDVNLNRLVISDAGVGACQDIINNGRTLMIRSSNGPRVRFQNDEYTSSNLHFHPLQNADAADGPVMNIEGHVDAKPEFVRYHSGAHEALCKHEPHLDPNRDVVGELHMIYTAKGKRALLLGANVKLGEPNAELGNYIDFLKAKKANQPLEIIDDVSNATEVAAKAVPATELAFHPLACFKGGFSADGLPTAPFMSLHLGGLQVDSAGEVSLKEGKSDVFYRGVRVIHLPEPVTISREQLQALRALQPVLKSVDEETCVHPNGRFQPVQQRWKAALKTAVTDLPPM